MKTLKGLSFVFFFLLKGTFGKVKFNCKKFSKSHLLRFIEDARLMNNSLDFHVKNLPCHICNTKCEYCIKCINCRECENVRIITLNGVKYG